MLMVEGPWTVAAIVLETVVGTNGILVPPAGYLQGVREICDEHGILLIADEVMAGFGRCGEWFAIDRWSVAPDLITFAKGVNSGYLPLGGVVPGDRVADTFRSRPYPGGLLTKIEDRHPAVGEVRGLGVFWALELVRDREARQPLVPFNAGSDELRPMQEFAAGCRRLGLWPMVHGNRVYVAPPCITTEEDVREGLEIIAKS